MKNQEETETKDKVSSETSKIYGEYFQLTQEYTEKYGEKTIVFMQVGSFFEMYGIKKAESEDMGSFVQVAQLCQFTISEKKFLYQKHPLCMAGFPDYRIDKYLQKVTEGGYTAVVYVQEKTRKTPNAFFIRSIPPEPLFPTIPTVLNPSPITSCVFGWKKTRIV